MASCLLFVAHLGPVYCPEPVAFKLFPVTAVGNMAFVTQEGVGEDDGEREEAQHVQIASA